MATVAYATMSIEALEGIRAKLQLEWEDLAAILGVDQSTLYRWRQRASNPRPIYLSRLQQLGEFMALLPRLFAGVDLARDWLKTAHPEGLGGGQTPLEVMRAGRLDRVLGLMHLLARGG